jgi:putative transposase
MQFSRLDRAAKPDIEAASDQQWQSASPRATVLQNLLASGGGPAQVSEAARELGLSKAMVYRLLARYRVNPAPSELLPKREGRVPGTHRLDDEVEGIVQGLIQSFYLKRQRPRVIDLYRQVAFSCRTASLPTPSYKAIQTRVKQLDPALTIRAREGAKSARDRFSSVGRGLRPTKPLELFQIDHTLADLILVDELERKPIGRPWLTLVIDVATRMIAGFHLSLDAPSATSVALAISHAVLPKTWLQSPAGEPRQWPIAGLPLIVHLDNAKEFHSLALERGCREHGISLKFRPPLRPHFGGHIERLIGTLMGEVHLLPGTTFSSIEKRGEYSSERKASLTLREFEQWLTLQIVDIYHQRIHRGIGTSPLAAWNTAIAGNAAGILHPANAEKFYIDFLPGETRLIRRDGIQLFNIHYWESALSPIAGRSKQKYLIRYDPRDLSHIYVKDTDGACYIKVPYRDISHPAITQNERRSVVKILSKKRAVALNEKTIFAAVLDQRVLVEKARNDTAAARRGREKINAFKESHGARNAKKVSAAAPEEAPLSVEPYSVEVWE